MAKIEGHQPRVAKEWAWSYSKLKNYETCPKRHYEIDVVKNYVDGGEGLAWGNEVHDRIAKACTGAQPLPDTMKEYQRWVDLVREGPGQLFVEQKYAITRDFRATTYFARDCWYRGIGDVVRIAGPVALILDWKTGKVIEDSVQLMLMAQCLFSHFPTVKRVRSEFIWLKEDCSTPEVFTREEIAEAWRDLLPRVNKLEAASKTMTYEPKPSGLCKKFCPVASCPFYGKGGR